ncbi:MAG: hypothetical protein MJ131_00075 [Lachnospiraceae bacterium]|nr:hypothetical protein [Lachnospiraceae bacterium]
MSNLIKGYMVNYPEAVKTLDMNDRAANYRRIYEDEMEKAQQNSGRAELPGASEDGEFRPGLFGERVVVNSDGENEEYTEEDNLSEEEMASINEEQLELLRSEAASIIEEAEAEAERIREAARLEAEELKEQIIREYRKKGYNEGRAEAIESCNRLEEQLERQIKENQEAYEKQVMEMEPAFVEVLIKLVGKITGVYASERTEVIMYCAHQALTKQTTCRNFIIRVSPHDYGTLLNSKPELLLLVPEGSQIEVAEDKMLNMGDCLIETDSRIFDCGVDTQLSEIIEDIKILAGTKE